MRLERTSPLISGSTQIAITVVGAPLLRHWYQRWGGYPSWCVVQADPGHALVLVAMVPDGGTTPSDADDASRSTWQWVLEPTGDGRGTRLISRTRTTLPRSASVLWHLLEPLTFVMERRMLLGIRERAERGGRTDASDARRTTGSD